MVRENKVTSRQINEPMTLGVYLNRVSDPHPGHAGKIVNLDIFEKESFRVSYQLS